MGGCPAWVMFRTRLKHDVRVITTKGDTIQGVCIRDAARWIVLANAERVEPDGEHTRLSGDVWIPREIVRIVQAGV